MSQTITPPDRPGATRSAPTMVASGRRERRWSLALVAVLITVGSGLAFVLLWLSAGDRKEYLALAEDVGLGQTIEADHLTTVRVSSDEGLDTISASERQEIIGQVATTDLLAGQLLVEDAVAQELEDDSGLSTIGIPVEAGKMPSGLQAGDDVYIYDAGASGDDLSELGEGEDGGASFSEITEAQVTSVSSEENANTITVSVIIEDQDARPIITAIQDDRIYLTTVR